MASTQPVSKRLEGTLRSWNDERGFGFIHPRNGGDDVFVHISAFENPDVRPANNQALSYEVEPGQHGKLRARNVVQIVIQPEPLPPIADRPVRRDMYGWLVLLLFIFLYLALSVSQGVSALVLALYVVASVVAIVVYTLDKHSSIRGGWRISEATLLAVGVLGGWPGAILAQQIMRHKFRKPAFRRAFWATVVLNVTALVAWHSPVRHWLPF